MLMCPRYLIIRAAHELLGFFLFELAKVAGSHVWFDGRRKMRYMFGLMGVQQRAALK